MKMVNIEQTTLDTCINDAQRERVVITRNGKPVALIVGIEGIDEEELELGSSDKFWTLIEERRTQKTINRAELEHQHAQGYVKYPVKAGEFDGWETEQVWGDE